MNRQGDYVHFCSAETDSAYAVGLLRRQKEKGALTRQEERMLIFMERRDDVGGKQKQAHQKLHNASVSELLF